MRLVSSRPNAPCPAKSALGQRRLLAICTRRSATHREADLTSLSRLGSLEPRSKNRAARTSDTAKADCRDSRCRPKQVVQVSPRRRRYIRAVCRARIRIRSIVRGECNFSTPDHVAEQDGGAGISGLERPARASPKIRRALPGGPFRKWSLSSSASYQRGSRS